MKTYSQLTINEKILVKKYYKWVSMGRNAIEIAFQVVQINIDQILLEVN